MPNKNKKSNKSESSSFLIVSNSHSPWTNGGELIKWTELKSLFMEKVTTLSWNKESSSWKSKIWSFGVKSKLHKSLKISTNAQKW